MNYEGRFAARDQRNRQMAVVGLWYACVIVYNTGTICKVGNCPPPPPWVHLWSVDCEHCFPPVLCRLLDPIPKSVAHNALNIILVEHCGCDHLCHLKIMTCTSVLSGLSNLSASWPASKLSQSQCDCVEQEAGAGCWVVDSLIFSINNKK